MGVLKAAESADPILPRGALPGVLASGATSLEYFEEQPPVIDTIPDGGLRAWLVALGGFLTFFVTFGLVNSLGTFQAYYQEGYLAHETESAISWIGSTQLFLLFFGGIVFGPLFDKKGAKFLFIPGTFVYVLSFMLTSLCTKYYQLMLAQGVLGGIGDAMLFYPTIASTSQWFTRRKGLAMGLVIGGSSLGGICWPFILQGLFNSVGFPWAMRITGFICLAFLLPSIILVIPRQPPKQSQVTKKDLADAFKDPRYSLLVVAMFFVFWGMFLPFYYLPLYGLSHHMTLHMANNLVATLNAGSFVGRLASGLLADKFGRFNMSFLCALFAGILLLCMFKITTSDGIIAFSVVYGFFSGGLLSLYLACVAQVTPNMALIGFRNGILGVCVSFALYLHIRQLYTDPRLLGPNPHLHVHSASTHLSYLHVIAPLSLTRSNAISKALLRDPYPQTEAEANADGLNRTLTGPYLGGSLIINAKYNYNNFIIFAGVILLFGAALLLAARLSATRNPWAVF